MKKLMALLAMVLSSGIYAADPDPLAQGHIARSSLEESAPPTYEEAVGTPENFLARSLPPGYFEALNEQASDDFNFDQEIESLTLQISQFDESVRRVNERIQGLEASGGQTELANAELLLLANQKEQLEIAQQMLMQQRTLHEALVLRTGTQDLTASVMVSLEDIARENLVQQEKENLQRRLNILRQAQLFSEAGDFILYDRRWVLKSLPAQGLALLVSSSMWALEEYFAVPIGHLPIERLKKSRKAIDEGVAVGVQELQNMQESIDAIHGRLSISFDDGGYSEKINASDVEQQHAKTGVRMLKERVDEYLDYVNGLMPPA